jgi:hypothetical protein
MEDQIGPIATIRSRALGWKGIQNGALLALAQQSEFEVLITSDNNLTYQQSQAGRHTHQDKALAGKTFPSSSSSGWTRGSLHARSGSI